mgnify:CR=1 FL=1
MHPDQRSAKKYEPSQWLLQLDFLLTDFSGTSKYLIVNSCYGLCSIPNQQRFLRFTFRCFVNHYRIVTIYIVRIVFYNSFETITIEQTAKSMFSEDQTVDLRRPFLRKGIVLKSPITAIGTGYRLTSERIHQRYYNWPVNLETV